VDRSTVELHLPANLASAECDPEVFGMRTLSPPSIVGGMGRWRDRSTRWGRGAVEGPLWLAACVLGAEPARGSGTRWTTPRRLNEKERERAGPVDLRLRSGLSRGVHFPSGEVLWIGGVCTVANSGGHAAAVAGDVAAARLVCRRVPGAGHARCRFPCRWSVATRPMHAFAAASCWPT